MLWDILDEHKILKMKKTTTFNIKIGLHRILWLDNFQARVSLHRNEGLSMTYNLAAVPAGQDYCFWTSDLNVHYSITL